MKLERLNEYLVSAVTILVGMGFALFAGNLIGQEQMGILSTILFFTTLGVVLLLMRLEVWVFIPMSWLLIGQTEVVPIPFSVRDITVMVVFGMYVILTALKQVRIKPAFGLLDTLALINVAYVVGAYVRNPVGLYAFNSDMVGGRPYFSVFIGVLAYLVLSRVVLTPQSANRAVGLTVLSAVVVAVLGVITRKFPETVPVIAHFYSGIDKGAYDALDVRITSASGRFISLLPLGQVGLLALCARFRPLTLLLPFYGWRFLGFLVVIGVTFASGFRSLIVYEAAIFLVASYFWTGMRDAVALIALGLIGLGILTAGQGRGFNLPENAQRALSFLPGKWDPLVKAQAESSTEWRVIMWREALMTDKYIQNKVWGDGFGFSRNKLMSMMSIQTVNQTDENSRETAATAGDFHSGPVSTIRFVGYVGGVLYYTLLGVMFTRAWRMIRRSFSTPYVLLGLFVGVPLLIEPFYFTFVFGGYQDGLATTIFGVGMMKVVERALAVHETERDQAGPADELRQPGLQPHAPARPATLAGTGGGWRQSSFRG